MSGRGAAPGRRGIQRRSVSGILLLDKPVGISSNDALQRAKRIYRAEKAGHTGSLDPLASGVLPLCFGEATKLCGVLLESDKCYRATAQLGVKTETGDAEGHIVGRSDPAGLDRPQLEATLASFVGPMSQIPPMYSALKHQGRPLYALAREGLEVERQPRQVTIFSLELLEFVADRFVFTVRCSKGTYIRTLVEDIAQSLGQYAHLTALRRTAVTPFEGENPIDFETLSEIAADSDGALGRLLMSPALGLKHWPSVIVDTAEAAALAHGRPIRLAVPMAVDSRVAILDARGDLLGLGQSVSDGLLAPRRWLQGA